MFILTDVCPQTGDAILDLGCGTGELSALLAGLVGPEGRVVGVDLDKERIQLAQQSHSQIHNLSFVEASVANFPGMGSKLYDIIFSNEVIHWIRDKEQVFKDFKEYESVKVGGKIAIQYVDHHSPFLVRACKELNPENEERINGMIHFEERVTIEQNSSSAGFDILNSYDADSSEAFFEGLESFLKWLWSSTHGVFDRALVTKKRLQNYLQSYKGQRRQALS